MAELTGMTVLKVHEPNVWFQIIPVVPSLEGPHDAYDCIVTEKLLTTTHVFHKQYDVHGWQLGHFEMFQIARAFQNAPKLIDEKQKFTISDPKLYLAREDQHFLPVYLRVGITWLQILMYGRTRKEGPRIFVEIYLMQEPIEGLDWTSQQSNYVRYFMICNPEDVQMFGDDLLTECLAAKEMRKTLGLFAAGEH